MTQTQEAVFYHGNDILKIDWTPGSALSAGEIVPIGSHGMFGIANRAIAANEKGALHMGGVYKIKKENTTETFAVGDKVSWDDTNGQAEADGGANESFKLGHAIATAAATDDYVLVQVGVFGYYPGSGVVAEEVSFTEAGDTTYTGSVNVPAGATILDVLVQNVALWDDGTSAVMDVGDAADPNGFFASVDLKATDLTAGQVINFNHQGGKGGAYITEGTSTHFLSLYSATARVVSGVVTTGGQNGTAGRTRMVVIYALPRTSAAVGA